MPSNLNAQQINMLQRVIDAANAGRYCHGNGADWVITDESRTIVKTMNHVTGDESTMTVEDSARYLASTPAHTSESTAKSLAEFISSK